MSILINGMEMPKTCNDCPLHELFFAFGKQNIVCSPTGHALGGIAEKHLKESRNAGYCPLIEVPEPHGRLIDADAMIASIKRQTGFLKIMGGDFATMAEVLEKGILQEIENAPTIIEAAKEGE